MSPEQHSEAFELFDELCRLPEAEREARLLTVSDPEVHDRVLALLGADKHAPESFLGNRAIEVAARLLKPAIRVGPGTVLGKYRLTAWIGAGGMGSVFEAQDLRLDRRVAVKILPPAFVSDPASVQRFLKEARAVSSLNHPNIVSIFDADQVQDVYYIATELVEGQTLRQLLSERAIDEKTTIEVAAQIASALVAAHAAGIIHRDIKPENVMVRTDGIVKVLDFGLAKLTEPASGGALRDLETHRGNIPGTLPYLSPEQILNKPAGPRSDLFSLGIVMYEMATGERPFDGETKLATMDAIVNRAPTPPSQLRGSISPGLEADILRAIEKDPELRFQTAGDLRASLRRLSRDSHSSNSDERVRVNATKQVGRPLKRRIAFATAGFTVVISGFAGWWIGRSGGQRVPLPMRFERLTDAPGAEIFPGLSPDGKQFFYSSDARGKWDIYLQRTGGQNAANLTADSTNDDTEPALSPDGARIAFRSERDGGGLFAMEATGENLRRIAGGGYLPAWSPDGKSIVYSEVNFSTPSSRRGPDSRLRIIDVSTGVERKLDTADAIQPSWSPHGHRIAYWGLRPGGLERDIFTVDVQSGGVTQVTNDPAVDWNPVWSPSGDHLYYLSDRGGAMNVWRVRINERTGLALSPPEPVTTPADSVAYLSFSADGRSFAYAQAKQRTNLFTVGYDPVHRTVSSGPALVGTSAHTVTVFSFSPDDKRLVYDSVGDPQEDLWIMNADGAGRRRLTDDPFTDRSPAWSPAGDEIVFMSNRAGPVDEWAIRADGSGLRRLTAVPEPVQRPVWTADGKRVLASRIPGVPIVIDADPAAGPANSRHRLPGLEKFDSVLFSPFPAYGDLLVGEWPGGEKGWELLFYDLAKGGAKRPGVLGRRPAWMPGNREVIFGRGSKCMLYDFGTGRETELFSVAPNTLYEIHSTHDGKRIYFTQTIREADLWLGRIAEPDPIRQSK